LLRAFEQAAEAAAMAVQDFAHPHEGRDGFAVLVGIHHAESSRENAFITVRGS
jgi:hypothetical protein